MLQSLFQVLSMNERVLVWSSQEDDIIVTWNQSVTLQAWRFDYQGVGMWTEVSIRTLSPTVPIMSFDLARAAAKRWLEDGITDDR